MCVGLKLPGRQPQKQLLPPSHAAFKPDRFSAGFDYQEYLKLFPVLSPELLDKYEVEARITYTLRVKEEIKAPDPAPAPPAAVDHRGDPHGPVSPVIDVSESDDEGDNDDEGTVVPVLAMPDD